MCVHTASLPLSPTCISHSLSSSWALLLPLSSSALIPPNRPRNRRTPSPGTWDEEQGGRRGEDDPAGGVVHLEAVVSQLLGLLLLLLLLPRLPSSVLNSEQV